MATFKRFKLFSRKSAPGPAGAAGTEAIDVPQELSTVHSEPGAAGELPRKARWQAYDFSSCMYETQTHPCGRSHSRKLSDLPPLADLSPALEADAGHHAQPQAQLQQPHSPSKLGPRGAGAARLTDDEAAPLDVVGGSPIVAASG